ncbi:hypothetical protein [Streptomyces sp. A30]|uniref:hypothetical protein n=1 Tax=Streptomyces sp. A30 TaxID=2789273 RepID=UPI003980ADC0
MVDLHDYPDGIRIIVRCERPHPGAQLSLFDLDKGLRYQVFLTDTPTAKAPRGAWRSATARMPASGTHPLRPEHRLRPTPFPPPPDQHRLARLALTALDLLARTASCYWRVSWAPPNPRSSATGCCTRPPASPAAVAGST